jgi:energy-coupling factor transporter transmembrane protein EcfT
MYHYLISCKLKYDLHKKIKLYVLNIHIVANGIFNCFGQVAKWVFSTIVFCFKYYYRMLWYRLFNLLVVQFFLPFIKWLIILKWNKLPTKPLYVDLISNPSCISSWTHSTSSNLYKLPCPQENRLVYFCMYPLLHVLRGNHYNKRCLSMPSAFTEFWVNWLVLLNKI